MSEDWFKNQIDSDWAEDGGCHPDEAQALQSYINSRTTPQEAAHAITQPILSSPYPTKNLNRLWNLLQDALIELPATYTLPLINLLQAIQDLPDPDLTSRPTEAAHPARGFTWKGLPSFGHLWADVHKRDNWRNELSTTLLSLSLTPNESLQKRQQLRATHIKKANVEAHLAVANVGSIPLDWGYDTVADALELKTAVLDFELPAAREWLEVAREELYRGAEEGRKSWALRKRDEGREDGRISMSRWKFWEEKIKEYEERVH